MCGSQVTAHISDCYLKTDDSMLVGAHSGEGGSQGAEKSRVCSVHQMKRGVHVHQPKGTLQLVPAGF